MSGLLSLGDRSRRLGALLWVLLAVFTYGYAVDRLRSMPRPEVRQELEVTLPRFAQLMLTAGDRYLAANLAVIRTMIAPHKMSLEAFGIQARIQSDAAFFNPAHEDNYYVAAAILPWFNQLDDAQDILLRADRARPFDWSPAFYYAFNLYHFKKRAIDAASILKTVAPRARSERDRMALEQISVHWFEKGYSPESAVRFLESTAASARSGGFKRYLTMRAERLKRLVELQQAAQLFQEQKGRPPASLDELVASRLIRKVPVDPFGFGYALDSSGLPILLNSRPKKKQ